jgi:hypothetical protein
MRINIRISATSRDFIFRIATPVSVATPDLIVSDAKGNNILVQVTLKQQLNQYLERLSKDFKCNKSETLTAIIETFATSGIKIDELLQVTYFAKEFNPPGSLKLKQSCICAALLMYLSKLNLNASEWQILKDTAEDLRGQKRKYNRK